MLRRRGNRTSGCSLYIDRCSDVRSCTSIDAQTQGQPDIRVLACFKGADNRYSECGKAPARAYCLKFGQPDVACFGDIKLVGKAATVDAYCETGECPAFGFIVCK